MTSEPGQKYKVKLRLENNLYTKIMYGYLIDDLKKQGINSSVIATLQDNDVTGAVTGCFPQPLEILYVQPVSEEEAMEVEVRKFSLFLQVIILYEQ